jgi:hypothetical protein
MIDIGKSLLNLTEPAVTVGAATILAFKILFLFRRDHAGQPQADQPV